MNYIQILYLCILKQLHCAITSARLVVNYIQILYLCILKQQYSSWIQAVNCCELHSNLVSLHSETTIHKQVLESDGCELHSNLVSLHSETTKVYDNSHSCVLWITFKSCIFAFWNNISSSSCSLSVVVNYIQILYLCILKQRSHVM